MTIQVFLLDGLTQVAQVTAFDLCEAIETDLAKGTWRLVLSEAATPAVVDRALNAPWLGIEITDTETGWRYGGPCTARLRTFTRNSAHGNDLAVELRGVDAMDYLDALLEWPDALDVTRWWITAVGAQPLSTAITNSLSFHGGPSGLVTRRIPNLTIVTPGAPFGPTKDWITTGLPTSELYRPWFNATDWTYRLALWRDPVGGTSALRFTTTPRATAPEIITPSLHDSITITETAATATFVAAMGEQITGQPVGERHALGVSTPSVDWRTRYREQFINRPSTPLASLQTEAQDALDLAGPKTTVQIDDFEITGYGLTVNLGDYVRVHYDDDQPVLVLPVASSRLTGDKDGWRRTVSVGNEHLVGLRQIASNWTELARRVRRVEGQL